MGLFCAFAFSCTQPRSATATVRTEASPLALGPPALVLLEAEYYDAVLNNNNNLKISTSALLGSYKDT